MEGTKINQTDRITTLDSEFILLTDSQGTAKRVSMADFRKSLIPDGSLDAIYDNVMILYHHNDNDRPYLVPVSSWPALERAGQIAGGVVITEGEKMLVVAPTFGSSLEWASTNQLADGFVSSSRRIAPTDWKGEENTAAIINSSKSGFITNTVDQAPGFCNLYSRANVNGNGLTAGKWWLPSLAELYMIYRNRERINYALKHIAGAEQLSTGYHWSSTQRSSSYVWYLNFSYGFLNATNRTYKNHVRPVSAFQ